MRDLINQIRKGLDAFLDYLCLFPTLALPDICSALESKDGVATGPKYVTWFDQHVAPKYTVGNRVFLSGQDCHFLRCSLLHQGSTLHPNSSYDRILLSESVRPFHGHCNISERALQLHADHFCRDVIDAVEQWLPAAESTPEYQTNYPRFVHYHPNGLAPHFVGWPLIG
jgi:hypothetical protein